MRGANEPSFHGRLKSGGLDDFIVQVRTLHTLQALFCIPCPRAFVFVYSRKVALLFDFLYDRLLPRNFRQSHVVTISNQEIGLDGTVCNVADAAATSAWKHDLVPKTELRSRPNEAAQATQTPQLQSRASQGSNNLVLTPSPNAQSSSPSSMKRNRCRDFSQGRCSRGNNCKYLHGASAVTDIAASAVTGIAASDGAVDNSNGIGSVPGVKRKERDADADATQDGSKDTLNSPVSLPTAPLPSLLPLEVLVPDEAIRVALKTAHDQYWVKSTEHVVFFRLSNPTFVKVFEPFLQYIHPAELIRYEYEFNFVFWVRLPQCIMSIEFEAFFR